MWIFWAHIRMKSTKELKRPLDLIEQKLNDAMIKMFD